MACYIYPNRRSLITDKPWRLGISFQLQLNNLSHTSRTRQHEFYANIHYYVQDYRVGRNMAKYVRTKWSSSFWMKNAFKKSMITFFTTQKPKLTHEPPINFASFQEIHFRILWGGHRVKEFSKITSDMIDGRKVHTIQ